MNDYFHGLQYSETGDCATMISSNYKMCYDVVPTALLEGSPGDHYKTDRRQE
eukprot:SAG22_NODE_2349_length_2681_cov_20.618900_2_plen_52_part_00